MLEDKALGLDMTAIGGLTSMLPVAYGISKFLSGVLGARTSPTILLSGAAGLRLADPSRAATGAKDVLFSCRSQCAVVATRTACTACHAHQEFGVPHKIRLHIH